MTETTLMVNGINCGGCSGPLANALADVKDLEVVSIATASQTGTHPNPVVLKHKCSLDTIRAAIAELDGT
jgi:copper chaperone CopZ